MLVEDQFDSRRNLQKNPETRWQIGDSDLIKVCMLHLFLAVEANPLLLDCRQIGILSKTIDTEAQIIATVEAPRHKCRLFQHNKDIRQQP